MHFSSLTTGIETLEGLRVLVYAYENSVYINNPTGAGTSEVYDMLGKKIGSQSLNQGINKLTITLNKGTYLVKTITKGKISLQKVVL